MLTGDWIDPQEAKAFADRLCENAPIGLRYGKRALNAAFEIPLETGLQYERSLAHEVDDTRNYREGFEARLEDHTDGVIGERSVQLD